MSIKDTHTMNGEAETLPESINDPAGTAAAKISTEDNDLRVELTDWEKEEFEDAVNAHDTDELRENWGRVEEALEQERKENIYLTEGENRLRGFGGGMMTVVEGEDSVKLYGPQRDFGASFKGMIDISAGRTTAEDDVDNWLQQVEEEFDIEQGLLDKYRGETVGNTEEDWETLVLREGAEEVVFTSQDSDEQVLMVPEYGNEEIDAVVQKAVLQEFLKAKNGASGFAADERSHLNDSDFRVETYEASAEAPEDAADIFLNNFYGEDYQFEAGIVPEAESSSLEAVMLNVVQERELPEDYIPQDTETVDIGDDNVHLDRSVYEMEISDEGVSMNLYSDGKLQESLTVAEYVDEMDREFRDFLDENMADYETPDQLREELGEEYGSSFATVKVLKGLEAIREAKPEYREEIDRAYEQLSRSSTARADLPWADVWDKFDVEDEEVLYA